MSFDTFRDIADRVRDPLLLLSPAGVVVAENRAACAALGEDLHGADLSSRTSSPEAFLRHLSLASRSTSPFPGSVSFNGVAGRWRCDASLVRPRSVDAVSLLLVHLRPATEAGVRFVLLNEQLARLHAEIRRREALETERSRLLESERRARELAEEAGRLKDDFLASVSHELRTPLHAISGWVALLRERPRDAKMLQRGLEVIERNVQSQTQLVEDLIDLSQSTSGRMRLEIQPVDLEEVARQAVESARPAAEAKRQRLALVADVGGCVVQGDPARLLQVIWNLLSNATKYTPVDGSIQIFLRRVSSHAEIIVCDNGQGIAPDLLPFVFDRFRRAEGTRSRRSGGLGIGLSIVRRLVELHGGLVVAESDGPGTGTTFTVSLPLPLFRPRSAVVVDARDDHAAVSLRGLDILLAEDNQDSRELLTSILEMKGAAIVAVCSSEEAQDAFRRRPPHVVLSDIEMPGEDGFTLMRKLRAMEQEIGLSRTPAIAVTAHTIGDARIHALRAGYQAFLSKPVSARELVALITSLCAEKLSR